MKHRSRPKHLQGLPASTPKDLPMDVVDCLKDRHCHRCPNHLACPVFLKGRTLHLERLMNPAVKQGVAQRSGQRTLNLLRELPLADRHEQLKQAIKDGKYGQCEHCQQPIEKKRLEARVDERYCLNCEQAKRTEDDPI